MKALKYTICERTGKHAYRTRSDARRVIRNTNGRDTKGYTERAAYVCRFCGLWHTTSQRRNGRR